MKQVTAMLPRSFRLAIPFLRDQCPFLQLPCQMARSQRALISRRLDRAGQTHKSLFELNMCRRHPTYIGRSMVVLSGRDRLFLAKMGKSFLHCCREKASCAHLMRSVTRRVGPREMRLVGAANLVALSIV